jgi:hypothetical protein
MMKGSRRSGGVLVTAVLMLTLASIVTPRGLAQEATPIVVTDVSPTVESTVQVQFELDLCYDSSTPGITEWAMFYEYNLSSTSTCGMQYGLDYDAPITISIYDAETMNLVDTAIATGPGLGETLVLPAGTYVFGESFNNQLSVAFPLDDSRIYALTILPHTADTLVTPSPGDGETAFAAQTLRCTSDNPELVGGVVFIPIRYYAELQPAAELGGWCDYTTTEGSFADLGALYLDRLSDSEVSSADVGPDVAESYGPWSTSPTTAALYPQGTYQMRFERFDGSTQVSEPFVLSGLAVTASILLYEGSQVTPTETTTATATATVTGTATATETTTVTATATSTSAIPAPTTAIDTLPNTGAGESGAGSLWLALGALLAIGIGSLAIAAQTYRRTR